MAKRTAAETATADEIALAIGEDSDPPLSDDEDSEYKGSPYRSKLLLRRPRRPPNRVLRPMPARVAKLSTRGSILSLDRVDSVISSDHLQDVDSDGGTSTSSEEPDTNMDIDDDASLDPIDISANTAPFLPSFDTCFCTLLTHDGQVLKLILLTVPFKS